jgi:hypothetical protein
MRLRSPVGRRASALAISLAALAAATFVHLTPVTTQDEATARIGSGNALNATTATYHLSHVRLTLEKVVALPEGMLGLRFSFGDSAPDCCSLFPRVALMDSAGRPAAPSTDIVIPASDLHDGRLAMHMWIRGTSHKPPFSVDLASLGVPTT